MKSKTPHRGGNAPRATRTIEPPEATDYGLPTVLLRPGEADRILAGHPWIYEGNILRLTREAEDGTIVQVKDHRQRCLGVGFFNSRSRIKVRMLSSERVTIGPSFFEERLKSALAVRTRSMPDATSYRVVNAESDFLSGLIVDRYEDVLVVQTSSLGMDRHKPELVRALKTVLNPATVMERNDMGARRFEGMEMTQGVLAGEPVGEIQVRLNGLVFPSKLEEGHKTGMYLDQQLNYLQVAPWARGAAVLDCFCFQGGFGLHAAKAGASQVLGIDQSETAVAAARRNAELNGFADTCRFEAGNVFDWLKAQASAGPHEKVVPRFDLIILDPPSFTRSRSTIPEALRGYKEIHLRAMKLLRPGGFLMTFCCSHHVSANLFMDVIGSAAYDARKMLRLAATYRQGPDHPIIPSIPETEYLKGFGFEVLGRP